jgi:hypothetical protein
VLLNYNNGPQQSETSATFVNIKINNQKCKVIVDSGAESTLVDYSVAKKLNLIIHEETDSVQYITANGEKLKTLGWSIMEVIIGSYKFRQKCVVVKNLCTNILLGTDALVTHGIILNYLTKTLSVGNVSLELFTKGEQFSFCLATSRRVEIKPLGSHVEWVKVPASFIKPVLVQGELLSHVKVSNGLFEFW